MDTDEVVEHLKALPDDVLSRISFAMPWNYDDSTGGYRDPDGFDAKSHVKEDVLWKREDMQVECWSKFHRSPQVSTAVRGLVGRMTGWGFHASSRIWEIQEVIEEIELDQRNRLYNFWPKYVVRALVEGELYLILTTHDDGFIEVDFLDPSVLDTSVGGGDGIIFHPGKTIMPLAYAINDGNGNHWQIPSVFVARFPELKNTLMAQKDYVSKHYIGSRSRKKKYQKVAGFTRFIVAWDRGFVTRRNISYIRTVIEWLNYYENLKKYEIDHKKSAGAYVWVVEVEDIRSFRLWLSLTDEQRRKTGIMQKKTPGATLVLPPGMKLTAQNPNLPNISDSDTDILHMVTGGLNEPEDVSTGQSKGTYASVKASRGPMSDRISDELAWFDRFLKYDFWGAIFYLRSQLTDDFPETFSVRMATTFKDKKPQFKEIKRRAEQLIDVTYPISEMVDYEGRAKGLLGTKHGSLYDTMGLPNTELARRMGFGNYYQLRLQQATEEEEYPDTILTLDQEAMQERVEGEAGKGNNTKAATNAKVKKATK